MQVSVKIAIYAAILFALLCLGVSVNGFIQTAELADPQTASDGRGFAFFWLFLAGVCAAIACGTWWISRTAK